MDMEVEEEERVEEWVVERNEEVGEEEERPAFFDYPQLSPVSLNFT